MEKIKRSLQSIILSVKAHPDYDPSGGEFFDLVNIAEKALLEHTPSESSDKGAEEILKPYILGAARSVGKGGNYEEYILCRDFEEIVEKIKSYASIKEKEAHNKAVQGCIDRVNSFYENNASLDGRTIQGELEKLKR